MGTIISNIKIVLDENRNIWVVKYLKNGLPQISQEFTNGDDAMAFELSLKFIDLE
jgi:hypothetical protein